MMASTIALKCCGLESGRVGVDEEEYDKIERR